MHSISQTGTQLVSLQWNGYFERFNWLTRLGLLPQLDYISCISRCFLRKKFSEYLGHNNILTVE